MEVRFQPLGRLRGLGQTLKQNPFGYFRQNPGSLATLKQLVFIPQNMVIIGFDLSRSHHFGAQHLSHGEGRRPGASATKLHAGRKKSLDIHRIMDRKITLL